MHSILPYSQGSNAVIPSHQIQWYSWWIHDQMRKQPQELFSTLQGYDSKTDDALYDSFSNLWQETARYMTTNTSVSINDIVAHLLKSDLLQVESDAKPPMNAKNLVFAVIGWQTMLYQADMHSCPPDQLAIQSEMGIHQGQAHLCLKQNNSACKRRMHDFLLGYGLLLPPRNFHALGSPEDKKAFLELKTVSPTAINAYIMSTIGDMTIEWVDSLACHLEFDSYLNKLFIFRYPSFCLAHIHSRDRRESPKSVIHACAACRDSTGQWATTSDVTQMLHETVLSYRLLFGQNKPSRQLFRKLKPFEHIPEEGRDTFLEQLCGQKRYQSDFDISERETYDLARDFPIFRSRLAAILRHLSVKKPRTWRDLWEDKRDSAQWLTFWAVLIIGGSGVFLALLQTILQIVQIVQH